MSKLGVGIIGAGWVAGEHVKAFNADPRAKVVAVCGRDADRTRACADRAGAACDILTDYEKLLARTDVDIAVIATPPNVHREQAVSAAQAGKHILLEKAMATTHADAQIIRAAVAKAGIKSVVSFVLRWNPLFQIIKAQLADNAIGRIYLGEVDYFHGIGPWYGQFTWNVKKDVGVSSLLSAGCHAVDALRWFMGGEITEVFQYSTSGGASAFAAYEYHPTSVTVCKFADGRIGKVASCIEAIQPYVFDIKLTGEHGSIRNNRFYSKTHFPGQTSWAEVPTILPDSGDVTHHPFVPEAAHLIDCILDGAAPIVDVDDAFHTHAVCFAADLSAKEGRPVQLAAL